MLLAISIVLFTVFIFTKIIKLPSYVPLLLSIVPLQQIIIIFYAYFFIEGLFDDFFIHSQFLNFPGFIYILINYCLYITVIYVVSLTVLKVIYVNKRSIPSIGLSNFGFSLNKLVILYLVISIIFLTNSTTDGFFIKIMRLTYYYISFVPLLVGYFIKKLNLKLLFLFFIILSIFTGVNLLLGSRGYFAILVITFTLGFLANKENLNLRKTYFVSIAVIAIVLFPIFSFVEQFRVLNGRITFKDFDINRLSLFISAYQSIDKTAVNNSKGLARLINMPNLSVILLTDVIVPKVGFSNFSNDLKFLFNNTFISGESVGVARVKYIDNLWGSSPANLYDYNVNETNSVEFSVMADGIWRYGQLGFAFNLIFILLIFLPVEKHVFRSFSINKANLLNLFILGNAYLILSDKVGAEPLLSVLRSLIYSIVFSFVFSNFFYFIFKLK
jgi:hypothetical protein